MAVAGSLIQTLLFWFAWHLGYFKVDALGFFLIFSIAWIGNLSFVVCIYTGLNLRFSDPSLTRPQILWVILTVTAAMIFTVEVRPLLLMAYLMVMLFGAFRLNLKDFIQITLITIVCYLSALLIIAIKNPDDVKVDQEILVFLSFLSLVVGFALMGGEFSVVRRQLIKNNKKLENALILIKELAITDELTGLHNRRYFMDVLTHQQALANRGGYTFVLCFFDLDHFKSVNDTYGHAVGDAVLKQFSRMSQKNIREVDYVARIGGEEFVVLLSDSSITQAKAVAERICKELSQYDFSDIAADLVITSSVGVTEYVLAEPVEATLERADQLLYRAKHLGRNCIVSGDEEDPQGSLNL
jgi:diguanylate cyclase (GGDEF)-like protein